MGPFVRKNDGFKYVIDELFGTGKDYSLMLPRVMMLSRKHFMTYRMIDPTIRKYVIALHCYIVFDMLLLARLRATIDILTCRHVMMCRYVDTQSAHCDDIMLNAAIAKKTGKVS